MLVEFTEEGCTIGNFLRISLVVHPHLVRLRAPEISLGLNRPIDNVSLVIVVSKVVAVLAAKHTQDSRLLVQALAFGLLPGWDLSRW